VRAGGRGSHIPSGEGVCWKVAEGFRTLAGRGWRFAVYCAPCVLVVEMVFCTLETVTVLDGMRRMVQVMESVQSV